MFKYVIHTGRGGRQTVLAESFPAALAAASSPLRDIHSVIRRPTEGPTRAEFEKWFLALNRDFGREELSQSPGGERYFYTTTNELFKLWQENAALNAECVNAKNYMVKCGEASNQDGRVILQLRAQIKRLAAAAFSVLED